jgi:hypothetical protein
MSATHAERIVCERRKPRQVAWEPSVVAYTAPTKSANDDRIVSFSSIATHILDSATELTSMTRNRACIR